VSEDLLNWFYPDGIPRLHKKEEETSRFLLDRMRDGKYLPAPHSYRTKTANKVDLEEVVADLSQAGLILFGQNIKSQDDIRNGLHIIDSLPSEKKITVACAIGDHHSMGGIEGLSVAEVLEDKRLKPEVDAYLRQVIETLGPKGTGRVIFPDEKRGFLPVYKYDNNKTLHAERSRRMGEHLAEYIGITGERVCFFGSNIWTLSETLNKIGEKVNAPVRAISHNIRRVHLADVPNPSMGVYSIRHSNNILEYVIVGLIGPKKAAKQADGQGQVKLLEDAWNSNLNAEELETVGGRPKTVEVYRKILALEEQLKQAKTYNASAEKAPQPATRPSRKTSGYETLCTKLEPDASQAGIRLPTRTEIGKEYTGAWIKESTLTCLAYTICELANGPSTPGPLSKRIAGKHNVKARTIEQFIRRRIINEYFPNMFSCNGGTLVSINPEYLKKITLAPKPGPSQ